MGCSRTPGAFPGSRHVVLAAVVTAAAMASLACGGKLPSLPAVSPTRAVTPVNVAGVNGTRAAVTTTSTPAGAGSATGARPPATTTPSSATTSAGSRSSDSQFQTSRYTVVSGDTPGGIAEKLRVPLDRRESWIAEMLSLNGVTATSLQIGRELILPPFDAAAPLPTTAASSASNAASSGDKPPAATEPPAPTEPPPPTATPPPATATQPPPTATPAPTIGPNTLNLVSVTSPVPVGSNVTLVVQVAPGSSCRLAYNNPSGSASQAAGLGTKTAGDDGQNSWTWQISPNVKEGTGTAYVTCGTKAMNVTIQTTAA